MNKKCKECKYKLIIDEQQCFFLGMDTESQLVPDEFEEYRSLEYNLKSYIKVDEHYLKNDLDSHNSVECSCCKNRFRAENSGKYFEEMLAVVNKRWGTPGWKLTIIFYVREKYFEEFGGF